MEVKNVGLHGLISQEIEKICKTVNTDQTT